jgi:hypothetical protein
MRVWLIRVFLSPEFLEVHNPLKTGLFLIFSTTFERAYWSPVASKFSNSLYQDQLIRFESQWCDTLTSTSHVGIQGPWTFVWQSSSFKLPNLLFCDLGFSFSLAELRFFISCLLFGCYFMFLNLKYQWPYRVSIVLQSQPLRRFYV